MEPCWLFHTCCGHQKSLPVYLTNTPLLPFYREGAFKTICLLGCSFMSCTCTIDYCIILFKSVCSPLLPTFFWPTPDLTTRKRSHFWEVTSMHVPCWVVTFNFLRPFMSHTRQPKKLQTHYVHHSKFSWCWFDIWTIILQNRTVLSYCSILKIWYLRQDTDYVSYLRLIERWNPMMYSRTFTYLNIHR